MGRNLIGIRFACSLKAANPPLQLKKKPQTVVLNLSVHRVTNKNLVFFVVFFKFNLPRCKTIEWFHLRSHLLLWSRKHGKLLHWGGKGIIAGWRGGGCGGGERRLNRLLC